MNPLQIPSANGAKKTITTNLKLTQNKLWLREFVSFRGGSLLIIHPAPYIYHNTAINIPAPPQSSRSIQIINPKNHRARRGHRENHPRSVLSVPSVADHPFCAVYLSQYCHKYPGASTIPMQPIGAKEQSHQQTIEHRCHG